jgi:hypothetical protein
VILILGLKGSISIFTEVNSIPKGSVSAFKGLIPSPKIFLVTSRRGDAGARRYEIIVRRGNAIVKGSDTIAKSADTGPLKRRGQRPERGNNRKKW